MCRCDILPYLGRSHRYAATRRSCRKRDSLDRSRYSSHASTGGSRPDMEPRHQVWPIKINHKSQSRSRTGRLGLCLGVQPLGSASQSPKATWCHSSPFGEIVLWSAGWLSLTVAAEDGIVLFLRCVASETFGRSARNYHAIGLAVAPE